MVSRHRPDSILRSKCSYPYPYPYHSVLIHIFDWSLVSDTWSFRDNLHLHLQRFSFPASLHYQEQPIFIFSSKISEIISIFSASKNLKISCRNYWWVHSMPESRLLCWAFLASLLQPLALVAVDYPLVSKILTTLW